VQELRRVCPTTVQVHTQNVASVVPINNTIRVEHGYDFENEQLSKSLCLLAPKLKYKIDDALYHK
jgi:hypothetical protein